MRQNLSLNLFLATLLFVAHLNCVVEHRLFALVGLSAVASNVQSELPANAGETPLFPEEDGCHLAGCICDGATLSNQVVFVEGDFSRFFVAELLLAPTFSQLTEVACLSPGAIRNQIPALSLRALQRCAILQSFQI